MYLVELRVAIDMAIEGYVLNFLCLPAAKGKRKPLPFHAFYSHLSAVMLDNLLRDIQANAQPWIGLVPVAINSIEALEDLLLRRFGDAGAEILDADRQRLGRVRDYSFVLHGGPCKNPSSAR